VKNLALFMYFDFTDPWDFLTKASLELARSSLVDSLLPCQTS